MPNEVLQAERMLNLRNLLGNYQWGYLKGYGFPTYLWINGTCVLVVSWDYRQDNYVYTLGKAGDDSTTLLEEGFCSAEDGLPESLLQRFWGG